MNLQWANKVPDKNRYIAWQSFINRRFTYALCATVYYFKSQFLASERYYLNVIRVLLRIKQKISTRNLFNIKLGLDFSYLSAQSSRSISIK